ncbi:hypothetical protein EW146_g10336 [Bondarzewia mesenterica]|uniref:Uncharacterized protein n=1 Tax=Bondarzewia mesenterica TaxID=1095465 RepID=A0A4S4L2W4_9AGAM|nr:hypothetical protein EW146_g10336 [Bondarzewia mesenterica]
MARLCKLDPLDFVDPPEEWRTNLVRLEIVLAIEKKRRNPDEVDLVGDIPFVFEAIFLPANNVTNPLDVEIGEEGSKEILAYIFFSTVSSNSDCLNEYSTSSGKGCSRHKCLS